MVSNDLRTYVRRLVEKPPRAVTRAALQRYLELGLGYPLDIADLVGEWTDEGGPVERRVLEVLSAATGGDEAVLLALWDEAYRTTQEFVLDDAEALLPSRQRQQAGLLHQIDAMYHGQKLHICIAGRAGAGKSYLLDSLLAPVHDRGFSVARVRLLSRGVAAFEEAIGIGPPPHWQDAAGRTVTADSNSQTGRSVRLERLLEALRLLTRPVAIVVDDLHKAPESLKLIEEIRDTRCNERVLILSAVRVGSNVAGVPMLESQVRRLADTYVAIGDLDGTDLDAFVKDSAGSLAPEVRREIAKTILQTTSGHAGTVAAVAASSLVEGGWRDSASLASVADVGRRSYSQWWRVRAGELTDTSLKTLRLAAFYGDVFPSALLELLPWSGELEFVEFDSFAPTVDSRFRRFLHDFARQALLDGVSKRDVEHSRSLLAELLTRDDGTLEPDVEVRLELAHAQLGESTARSVLSDRASLALRLGRLAVQRDDLLRAQQWFEDGMADIEAVGGVESLVSVELLSEQAQLTVAAEKVSLLVRALRVALRVIPFPSHLCVQLVCELLEHSTFGEENQSAIELAEQVRQRLEASDGVAHRRLRARELSYRLWVSDPAAPTIESAVSEAEDCLAVVTQGGSDEDVIECFEALGTCLLASPSITKFVAAANRLDQFLVQNHLAVVASLRIGDGDAFRRLLNGYDLPSAANHPWHRAMRRHWEACILLARGELAAADKASELMAKEYAHVNTNFLLIHLGQQIWGAAERGQHLAAADALAVAASRQPNVSLFAATRACFLSRNPASRDLAQAELDRSIRAIDKDGLHDISVCAVLCMLAEAAFNLDSGDAGGWIHDRLLPFRGQMCVVAIGTLIFGSVDRFLAQALAAANPYSTQVAEYFDRALRKESEFGAPALAARTLRAWRRWNPDLESSPLVEVVAAELESLSLKGLTF